MIMWFGSVTPSHSSHIVFWGRQLTFDCISACDKSDVCRQFIQCHKHSPLHLHSNLFARLSKSALCDLTAAESSAQKAVDALDESDKHGKQQVGEGLLDSYMQILSRPGSFVSRGICAHLSLTLTQTSFIDCTYIIIHTVQLALMCMWYWACNLQSQSMSQ